MASYKKIGTGKIHLAADSRRTTTSSSAALRHAVHIVYPVCCLAGSHRLLEHVQSEGATKPLGEAVAQQDTPALFNWLVRALSFQGVSDRTAAAYMEINGAPTWDNIASRLAEGPSCPKLRGYHTFSRCGYSKSKKTCERPEHFARCPVPRDVLRNGRLNQTAYSLYFFMRDVANGDLVGWVSGQLQSVPRSVPETYSRRLRESLIGPLRQVYGIADKVLSMTLASLLLAAPVKWTHWRDVGGGMIAIDTLVHKLLHRTGILRSFGAQHHYGERCYGKNGCAEIIERISGQIDAREFNDTYPRNFPRFVQHALWRWCAQDGFSICNSVRIKDGTRCVQRANCRVFRRCRRRSINVS